jgi:hypothetical protein
MAGQRTVILFDPISDSVQNALQARTSEFSKARNVTIFSGTWNLNGEPPEEALDAWLFPPGACCLGNGHVWVRLTCHVQIHRSASRSMWLTCACRGTGS